MLTSRQQVRKAYPDGIQKLEIGSGMNPEPGYIHLDIQDDLPDLEILSDVRKMPLPDNFVSEEIRAVHIMEHFNHPEHSGKDLRNRYGTTIEVVKECYRVLNPGGKLRIVTPDFRKIAVSEAKRRVPRKWLQAWTVGGHLNEYDVHHWLWTHEDAEKWFSEAGFHTLNDWNPIRGPRTFMLNWDTPDTSGNMEWHRIEWYHWLFFEGTK